MSLPDKIYLGNKFYRSYFSSKVEDRLFLDRFLNYIEEQNIDLFIAQRQRKSFEINFKSTSVKEIRNEEVGFL